MAHVESVVEQEQHRLAFSCYVFSTAGRFLFTMRGPGKRTWQGVWTNSCSGRAMPGEPLTDAVARTLHRELGLVGVIAEPVRSGEPLGGLWPVYRVVTDQIPHPGPAEVGDFEWVAWSDFVYAVTTGEISVSPWCRAQVARLRGLGADPIRWPVAETVVPAA